MPTSPLNSRRRLSTTQLVCIVVLWLFLVYWILTRSARIDGIVVVSIVISGALVGIPIYKELKQRKTEQ